MRNILLIYKASFQSGLKIFKEKQIAKQIVIYAFLLLLIGLVIGSHFFFKGLFGFLILEEQRVGVLVFYTLGISFLITFIILLFSSFIFFSGYLFKSETNRLIQILPIEVSEHFLARFLLGTLLSLWPILILGGPALTASFHVLENISTVWATFFLFSLVAFSTIAISAAASLVVVFTRFIGSLVKPFTYIFITVAGSFLTWRLSSLLFPKGLDKVFTSDVSQNINELLSLDSFHPTLPSTWLIKAVWGLVSGQDLLLIQNLVLIWLTYAIVLLITFLIGSKLYQNSLSRVRESVFLANGKEKVSIAKSFKISGSEITLLLQKEVLTFFRDGTAIGYLLFLFFLGLVYIFILSKVPPIMQTKPTLAAFLLCANIAFVSYLGLVASLRFLFPSVSLEGKGAWILYSLPLETKNWLVSKFVFFGSLVSAIGIFLGILSSWLLGLTNLLALSTTLVIILIISFGAISNLAIGALLPNFQEDGAESAATSAGGILSTLLNLIIVFLITAASFFFFESYLMLLPSGGGSLTKYWATMLLVAAFLTVFGFILFDCARKRLKTLQ